MHKMGSTFARIAVAIASFFIITVAAYFGGLMLIILSGEIFPTQYGFPGSDPHGRSVTGAIDPGIGAFVYIILGIVGAWLAWVATDKRNWSIDLAIGGPVFLIFAIVSSANYIHIDILFSRDAQALLNILLAASGAAVIYVLQKPSLETKSIFMRTLATSMLAICMFGFVAVPLWYTVAFMSWKFGAGSLDSVDGLAKAIGAMGSILAAVGLSWKGGRVGSVIKDDSSSRDDK